MRWISFKTDQVARLKSPVPQLDDPTAQASTPASTALFTAVVFVGAALYSYYKKQ